MSPSIAKNPSRAAHRAAPLRLRVRPLVASLSLALALGAADTTVAQSGFLADFSPKRPFSGVSGPLHLPTPAPRALPSSQRSRAPAGNTLVIQNCNDSGVGSLRDIIAGAPDGATITFGDLACSTITLTSGAIAIVQHELHIEGPGRDALAIDGNNLSSVFRQSDVNGELSIQGLTIANGLYEVVPQQAGTFGGGCIYSNGKLALTGVTVENCGVDVDVGQFPGSVNAAGGGVLTFRYLRLDDTIIRNCHVDINANDASGYSSAGGGGVAVRNFTGSYTAVTNSLISGNAVNSVEGSFGGGLLVNGGLSVISSTIENNSTLATEGDLFALGGGVHHIGTLVVVDSTVSGNHAGNGGGVLTYGDIGTSAIYNSTISGNLSSSVAAGILCQGDCSISISNSTVAFNEAGSDQSGTYDDIAAGIVIAGDGVLQSVVVAGNAAAGLPADFSLAGTSSSVTGSNNLIVAPKSTPPPGTIVGEDPLLAPLASNGGPTATHALLFGSPALDTGNNDMGLVNDQRGAGFPRVIGAGVDIGAFEFTPASLVVENCADSGVDSLRDIIAGAPDGATITFGDLACSTITLTSGAIEIAQPSLHIDGPGRNVLSVDGNDLASVFRHSGNGEFSINGLTIAHGFYDSVPQQSQGGGGCISSAGDVTLTGVTVEHCVVDVFVPTEDSGFKHVAGGGVLALRHLNLNDTIIRQCTLSVDGESTPNFQARAYGGGAAAFGATSNQPASIVSNSLISDNQLSATDDYANGGGLFVNGELTVTGSAIANNSALSAAGELLGRGGGVYHFGDMVMSESTISANHAGAVAGLNTASYSGSSTISNSTISGNVSAGVVAGVNCAGDCLIRNSTIAFNVAGSDIGPYGYTNVAAGVVLSGTGELHSVVISGNEVAGVPADFSAIGDTTVVTGTDNLITAPNSPPPLDTIVGEDPLLAPLANNGGLTATHALLPGSPAIETGNNDAGLASDQRGTGFARVVGAHADIGAFELDPDRIFRNGFD